MAKKSAAKSKAKVRGDGQGAGKVYSATRNAPAPAAANSDPQEKFDANPNPAARDNSALIAKIESRRKLDSLPEKLANSRAFYMNWTVDGAEAFFLKEQPRHRVVDYYFPHAEGGPLLVDTPNMPHEIKRCAEKKLVFEKLGHCYVVIDPYMSDEDAFMELDECRGRLTKSA